MKTYYAPEADVFVMVLGEGTPADTKHLGPVSIVFDEAGQVIEVEIGEASKHAPQGLVGSALQLEGDLSTLASHAEGLGLSPVGLRRAAQEGKLKAFKLGKVWMARRADVDAWRGTVGSPGRQRKAAPAGEALRQR